MKLLVSMLVVVSYALASADRHAPIGVMLDHTHNKGEFMFSLRHMKMKMKGISRREKDSSIDDYFGDTNYMMAPSSMSMDMTMFGAMYGLTDNLTLTTMIGYSINDMTIIKKMGRAEVKTKSSALTDTKVNVIYSFYDNEDSRSLISLGFSVPTGSIDEKDNSMLLGFPMQTGSGSYGIQSYYTYVKYLGEFSLGTQLGFKTYLNDNDQDYRVGDTYESSLWTSYCMSENLSYSLRLSYMNQDVFEYDSNRTMSAPVDFRSLNGQFTTLGVGINYLNTGYFKGHRLAFEIAKQVDSNFSGYQLKRSETITLGWQKAI